MPLIHMNFTMKLDSIMKTKIVHLEYRDQERVVQKRLVKLTPQTSRIIKQQQQQQQLDQQSFLMNNRAPKLAVSKT
jgi:hypothetical protein